MGFNMNRETIALIMETELDLKEVCNYLEEKELYEI